jgi:hypothetical protein
MLPTKFRFIWPSGFRGEDLNKSTNQKQELPVVGLSRAILVSDWSISKKSSLKLLGQMNRHLVGSIYGRSSINIAHFILIRLQTWPPHAILVSDWSISNKNLL